MERMEREVRTNTGIFRWIEQATIVKIYGHGWSLEWNTGSTTLHKITRACKRKCIGRMTYLSVFVVFYTSILR